MTAIPEKKPPFKVGRWRIVARGLTNRCPNCGGHTLFQKKHWFKVNRTCPRCGMTIERVNDEGFFLGSMSLNYGATLVFFLTPIAFLAFNDRISATLGIVLAAVCALGAPILLYRPSRSWWLMNYYIFLPQHLPVNREGIQPPDEDENI